MVETNGIIVQNSVCGFSWTLAHINTITPMQILRLAFRDCHVFKALLTSVGGKEGGLFETKPSREEGRL